jgi:hypothetical protein
MRTTPTSSTESLLSHWGKNIRKTCRRETRLTTETVKSAALSLEGVDNIERCNRLALGVLSVCDCISDNTFEEGLQNTSSLFVDHWETC